MKKSELVPLLVEAAIVLAQKFGREDRFEGQLGTHLMASVDGLSVIYRTPRAMLFTAPSSFGIDVWEARKCFSVIWNFSQLRDYEVIRFQRGPWIPKLIASSME